MCKNIGCEFYCEELSVVKHKSKYSCKSEIFLFRFRYNQGKLQFQLLL